MKILRWLVMSGLFAGLTLWLCAQSTPAPDQPAQAGKPGAPSSPAKPPAAKPKAPEKKMEEEPKIPGITIPRDNGTFLGLEIAGGKFKLSFYDAKKKPMAPDVTRAVARWPNRRTDTGDWLAVLNPSGNTLAGDKFIDPPYTFNVYLTLLQGDGDDAQAVETYVVPFHD